MKTVVATYLTWFKDRLLQGPPYPPVNLMLVGNEENGETEAMGTPHLLRLLAEENLVDGQPYAPALFIAGERTGERGDELWGEICTQNRGVMRFDLVGHGAARPFGPGGRQRPGRAPARCSPGAGRSVQAPPDARAARTAGSRRRVSPSSRSASRASTTSRQPRASWASKSGPSRRMTSPACAATC